MCSSRYAKVGLWRAHCSCLRYFLHAWEQLLISLAHTGWKATAHGKYLNYFWVAIALSDLRFFFSSRCFKLYVRVCLFSGNVMDLRYLFYWKGKEAFFMKTVTLHLISIPGCDRSALSPPWIKPAIPYSVLAAVSHFYSIRYKCQCKQWYANIKHNQ